MGSCGFCYVCHRPILTYEESLLMGNPILFCKECQERFEQANSEWNRTIKEEMEK